MADYEEPHQGIEELEEQLDDSIDEYVRVHDDPDQDEATRTAALHHHSKTIAYTAREILAIEPDNVEVHKLLAMFALSLNGQFQPHHYHDLGIEDENSEYQALNHHPWKSEYLPEEDHSELLDAANLPNEPHHHHNGHEEEENHGDDGEEENNGDDGDWNEEGDGYEEHEEHEAEMPQEDEGDEEAEGHYEGHDDGQDDGDEGWHSGDEYPHGHSHQHDHEY
ncbi:hypothetical protein AYL99_00668 [Fonsecaea erecta]|uniref:Uncharacterized protein n=1 Tax=Fonsecaea erecta TaxID=1367422 RepID=A0A178ZZ85_9EURO|nr:hypothetical protein AYL99_00668 [Fonsecaea erecta]OAP64696.1 hypothetical protein AYL99_00668 [Fonsecaea erecta]